MYDAVINNLILAVKRTRIEVWKGNLIMPCNVVLPLLARYNSNFAGEDIFCMHYKLDNIRSCMMEVRKRIVSSEPGYAATIFYCSGHWDYFRFVKEANGDITLFFFDSIYDTESIDVLLRGMDLNLPDANIVKFSDFFTDRFCLQKSKNGCFAFIFDFALRVADLKLTREKLNNSNIREILIPVMLRNSQNMLYTPVAHSSLPPKVFSDDNLECFLNRAYGRSNLGKSKTLATYYREHLVHDSSGKTLNQSTDNKMDHWLSKTKTWLKAGAKTSRVELLLNLAKDFTCIADESFFLGLFNSDIPKY
jgi:hypothetical protein